MPAGPGEADWRIELIVAALPKEGADLLRWLAGPDSDSAPPAHPAIDRIAAGLAGLDVTDPSGLVTFRVQLLARGPGGLALTALGRAVHAALQPRQG